eukprot:TRINITY_DN9426_c0_g1_i1.p1 TRINITY_DN9426_c0_g1~~TRINITY_DN9426_c0_g1_i1.p1  ORF type:complete len:228 (-),score=40.26 TRINITY_DN9426_c0_g1_i1:26-640(-)
MPKTKRVDDKKGPQRKKLHLDPLLTKETPKLVEGYAKSELNELFDRCLDLEEEILRQLKFDDGVTEVIGTKLDGGTLWFYVLFSDNNKGFLPASILKKVSPLKMIEYFESRLQFLDVEPNTEVGLKNLQKSKQTLTSSKINKSITQKRSRPKPVKKNKPEPVKNVETTPDTINTVHCDGCKVMLQYPTGCKVIRCPRCLSTQRV